MYIIMPISEKEEDRAISKGAKTGKILAKKIVEGFKTNAKNRGVTVKHMVNKLIRIAKVEMRKTKKLIKKINKTYKNKPALNKCNNFCENEYMDEVTRIRNKLKKHMGKTHKRKNPFKASEIKESSINNCKKAYCNPECEGYSEIFKKFGIDYNKTIKNGFKKDYTKEDIQALKEKGVLSGCMVTDYNVHHP
jgi:hypothetical protein